MHKKITLFILMVFACIAARATYIPVAVTSGYNADVVANGVGAPNTTSTDPLDAVGSGANFVFVAQDYNYDGTCTPPVAPYYLPTGGLLTSSVASTFGLTFQLADYNNNNCLHLATQGASGTLVFGTPVAAPEIYLLGNSGSGVSVVDVLITFTDATTQLVSNLNITDWYGGSNVVVKAARVARTATACGVAGNPPSDAGPNLYQILINLDPANYAKLISSITVTKTNVTNTGFTNIMGVTVNTVCSTPVDQPTALNLAPTTSQIAGSFTPAVSNPSHYLVVRYPAAAVPVLPVDATFYTVGASLGSGTVVAIGTGTSFTATGLFANTSYDFYVYAYNLACAGTPAPLYNTASPLFATVTTPACGGPGNVTIPIGPGQTYISISDAVTALTASGITGPVVLELQFNYSSSNEPSFPITFPFNPCVSPANNIIVRPAANAPNLDISGSNAGPTIDLDGAANITIDGRPGGVGSMGAASNLRIINTNTAGVALRMTNDATNNTIQYCNLQSVNTSNTAGTTPAGVIYIGGAGTNGIGNDNNTISNCEIHGTGTGSPAVGIMAYGSNSSPAAYNDNIVVDNCYIYDYFVAGQSMGIKVDQGNSAWSITNNSFYQSLPVTYSSAVLNRAMHINSNGGSSSAMAPQGSGFIITGNIIGGSGPAGAGIMTMAGAVTHTYYGMDISVGVGAPTLVQNNTITNISFTSNSTATGNFIGINVNYGAVDVSGNTIGDNATAGAITVTKTASTTVATSIGIRVSNGTAVSVSNNTIAGLTTASSGTFPNSIMGISVTGGTANTISSNMIGSTSVANSLYASTASTGAQQVTGINVTGGTTNVVSNNTIASLFNNSTSTSAQTKGIVVTASAATVSGNTITDLTSSSPNTGSGTGAATLGIAASSSGAYTISGNTIYNLNNNAASANVNLVGIFSGGSAGNVIAGNLIYALNTISTGTGVVISGMDIGAGPVNVANNMISLGYDAGALDITAPICFRGITKGTATPCNFYYNSVYIGGGGVSTSAASMTFAFQRNNQGGADNIMNNIFVNERSNAGGSGGAHYAISFGNNTGAAGNIAGVNLNFNNYYVSGTGGVMGFTTADVPSYTSGWIPGDVASVFGNPQFVNPNAAGGGGGAPDLHISTSVASVAESGGTVVAGMDNDYDGDIRYGSTGYTGTGTAPDLGADEFGGVSPAPSINSVSITPTAVQCAAVLHTVTANITPGGGPLTSVTLNFSFDGVAQAPVSMTGGNPGATSNWTADIPVPTPGNAVVTWYVMANDATYSKSTIGTAYSDEPLNGASVLTAATSNPVCAGNASVLSASFGKSGTITVGVGNSTSSSPGSSPFYHSWGGQKVQYIFSQAELSALGLKAGDITALSFEITSLGTTNLNGFAISLGNTAQSSFSSYSPVTGVAQVYAGPGTNNAQTLVAGVNNITFNTPFNWDGTSNLVVQVCWSNNNTGGSSSTVKVDGQPVSTTAYVYGDNQTIAAVCGATGPLSNGGSGTTTTRPRMTFTGNKAAPATTYAWSDGSSTVAATASFTITPSVPASYTATLTDQYGCSLTSAPLSITIAPVTALAGDGAVSSFNQADGMTYQYTDGSCNMIASVTDAAGGNALGNMNSSVFVDAAVQTSGGQPYLQRHYTITPASNGPATVTLFALQPEFDAYNLAAGAYPLMPVTGSNSDPNIGNIRVSKYSGTPFTSGTGTALITPSSVNWNSTGNWWEITFPVTSFSSFYIHTGTLGPLDITLEHIDAANAGSRNRIDWSTAGETTADRFELERSLDGTRFSYLGAIEAKGKPSLYTYWDEAPAAGLNYYRLKMYNTSGSYSYSKTVTAAVRHHGAFIVEAYPNPVTDQLTIRTAALNGNAVVQITDVTGKLLKMISMDSNEIQVDMKAMVPGVYLVRYADDAHSQTVRISKQ